VVFDDVEEVFANMEDVFGRIDTDINSKLNKLKMKIAAKKPDKYEYVPDPDKDDVGEARWQEHLEERRWKAARAKKALRNLMVFGVAGMLILFAILFFILAVDNEKDAEFGAPSKGKPAITEKLEKL